MPNEQRHWTLDDEVTESALASDADLVPDTIARLRRGAESSLPPPFDAELDADVDPSIR